MLIIILQNKLTCMYFIGEETEAQRRRNLHPSAKPGIY